MDDVIGLSLCACHRHIDGNGCALLCCWWLRACALLLATLIEDAHRAQFLLKQFLGSVRLKTVLVVTEYRSVSTLEHQLLATLTVIDELAVVTAVGRHMANTPGISGKIFGALGKAGINVRMIMQGLAELNMLIGVENKDFDNAVRVLYDSFMK